MNNLETVKKRAREILVGPIDAKFISVTELVILLQGQAAAADGECDPEQLPPMVPFIFREPKGVPPLMVTLELPERVPLAVALDELCRSTGATLTYLPGGIVIDPPQSDVAELTGQQPKGEPSTAAGSGVPGVATLPQATPPSSSAQPPSAPAKVIEIPWTIGAGFSAVTPEDQEAFHEWRRLYAEVVAKYPALGLGSSRVYAKFLDLYTVYHGSPIDLMSLADLVMVYPPQEPLLA